MWSSVVAHPPQDMMFCVIWDAFLLTMIVKSAYLIDFLSVQNNLVILL